VQKRGTFERMKTTTLTYTDPRELEGTPFDAARGAGDQATALLGLAGKALDDFYVIARVAELQRQQDAGEEPDAVAFEEGALAGRLTALKEVVAFNVKTADKITAAASYNPLQPPKEA
jgi:hypothetical protein